MGRLNRWINSYETQILQSGQKYDTVKCDNEESHKNYIKVSELPEHIQDYSLLEFVSIRCNLTVMIEVRSTNQEDTGVLCGSGCVQKIDIVSDAPCPCRDCKDQQSDIQDGRVKQSDRPDQRVTKWGKVTISTALHVIKNEANAQNCRALLFFDTPDSSPQYLYGLRSHSRDADGDWCALVCTTHDTDLLNSLSGMLRQHWQLGRSLQEKYHDTACNQVIVVSHPHGGPKCVSFGKGKIKDLAREVRVEQDWCYYSYDATTCGGSSGGPVYVLGRWNDGFGYWFGHAHNHSGIDNRQCSSSTVGVDSTYGQLVKPFSSIHFD